ncbi:hypothetical protein JG688_00017137 [Phytophthora aleatoria]|uniref:Uncharacterized protein n=1 Tax=Phytophthora aleatoria TaxID=2496075 RepID=A0A8J5IXG6_9STRA|nr:hypothetical protein JG688_00017137 [Phytophthora aleatoria]
MQSQRELWVKSGSASTTDRKWRPKECCRPSYSFALNLHLLLVKSPSIRIRRAGTTNCRIVDNGRARCASLPVD